MPIKSSMMPRPLLEQMAVEIARLRDPRARHWLVCPGTGRAEWVQRRWAALAGIASRSQMVAVRSLIEQAAAGGAHRPFSAERLVLAVAQALPDLADRLPLPRGTPVTPITRPVLEWSRVLADALDLGLLCRPTAPWAESAFLGELADHTLVEEALSNHLGRIAPPSFHAAVEAWIASWSTRGGVPYLWMHLDAGLPQILMDRLADLLHLLPADRVHLSLLNPGSAFWGDLATNRRVDAEHAGPVLRSFGRLAQDLHNQSIDALLAEGAGEEDVPPPTLPASLLGALQQACRSAHDPETRLILEQGESSFTIHACRSPLRELEVARDRIIQAIVEIPDLHPADIQILLADPGTYAPLVGAALQPGEGTRLPFRLLGAGGLVTSPIAEALQRLLLVLRGRLTLSELQSLVEDPLIAQQFGFDQALDDGQDVVAWLADAGFRWGVDAAQRAEAQGPGERRWSLDFALRRLGLGAVVEDHLRDHVVDGDIPLERASGLSVAVLARVASFAQALKDARLVWGSDAAQPMTTWCDQLRGLCDIFLSGTTDRLAGEHRTQVNNTILPALERLAPRPLALTADAFMRLLTPHLEALAETAISTGGGITVAALSHVAGTPARMVVVVGLGSETFPGRDVRPGWHPLSSRRAPGDPDQRASNRHALLLALLACSERCVLTYSGGSDSDDKVRPPSTPLADLLGAVDQVAVGPGGVSAQAMIHIRHGLNGFTPLAFAPGLSPSRRGWHRGDALGAARLADPDRRPYQGLWSHALSTCSAAMTSADLLQALKEPCRLLIAARGLRLPHEGDGLPTGDILTFDSLDSWAIRDLVLQNRLLKGDDERLHQRLVIAGSLPRGQYGDSLWDKVVTTTPTVLEDASPWEVEFNLLVPAGDGGRIHLGGRLPSGWYRTAQGAVHHYSASKFKPAKRLSCLLLGHLLAACHQVREVTCIYRDAKPVALPLPPADEAVKRIGDLAQLVLLARQLPLPWWPDCHAAILGALESGKSIDQVAMAGLSVWQEDGSDGTAAPSRLPASRWCFRGCSDPFSWRPAIEAPWLPGPDEPLAVRLSRWIALWSQEPAQGRALA